MPGKGPAPKPVRSRPRDNARREAATAVLVADGVVRGPDLPPHPGDGWHPQTLAWWQTLRTSALSTSWVETDWSYAADSALLHTSLWLGNAAVASELRLRVCQLGVTPEARLRLRIRIDEDVEQAPVRDPMPASRRARLLRAVPTSSKEGS